MTNKVALISGGGGGFGRTVAKAFSDDGYRIALCDIDASRLKASADSLGHDTLVYEANLTNEADVEKMVKNTVQATGRIDFLFMSHGIVGGRTLLHEVSLDEWNSVVQTNLTGTFLCMKHVLPVMIGQRRGSIISLATGDSARKFSAPYIASKIGIEGLTVSVATEAREWNIGVYAVSPGGYANTLFHDHSYSLLHSKNYVPDEQLRRQVRAIEPEVILPFCKFAIKDDSLSLSGKTVNALDWNEQHGLGRDTWYV